MWIVYSRNVHEYHLFFTSDRMFQYFSIEYSIYLFQFRFHTFIVFSPSYKMCNMPTMRNPARGYFRIICMGVVGRHYAYVNKRHRPHHWWHPHMYISGIAILTTTFVYGPMFLRNEVQWDLLFDTFRTGESNADFYELCLKDQVMAAYNMNGTKKDLTDLKFPAVTTGDTLTIQLSPGPLLEGKPQYSLSILVQGQLVATMSIPATKVRMGLSCRHQVPSQTCTVMVHGLLPMVKQFSTL